jgi:hypothetical protein
MPLQSSKLRRVCVICQTTFFVFPYVIRAGGGTYCSPNCRHRSQQTRVLRSCDCCAVEFLAYQSEIRKGGGKFCSLPCSIRGRLRRQPTDPLPRFWAQVRKTESCWLWTGSLRGFGYGCFMAQGKTIAAHRFSWQIHQGAIPPGKKVLHKCPGKHNPACVNPAHLALGDTRENVADREAQRAAGLLTTPRPRPPSSRFTPADIQSIRTRHAARVATQDQLAAEYQVGQGHISLIVRRRIWKDLP